MRDDISSGCDLFMQCVSQLVRDSREFSTLLGRMEPGTGVRRPGAIDKVRNFWSYVMTHNL